MKSSTRSIAKWLLFLPFGFTILQVNAQGENLVPNGSFEGLDKKPKKLGQIEMAKGWTSPTGARADLFAPGAKVPEIGTPSNAFGSEAALEGENYAGIIAYSHNDKLPRTYISAKLATPMKKGMKYCVSYNVALAELSKYAISEIGMNINKKEFATEEKVSILDETHIKHPENKVMNAMYGWDKICGVYTATGGEKYITIGNFSKNDAMVPEKNKKSPDVKGTPIIAAYYYIDDVVITLLEDGQKCDCSVADEEGDFSKLIYQKTVLLTDKMSDKQKIEAQAVYFAFGKDQLQPQDKTALDLIAELMKKNPAFKLQVNGHNIAEEDALAETKPKYEDMDLKRIEAIIAYLTEKGVEEHRLIGTPQGADDPSKEVSDSDDDELKQAKNRRVQFVVRQQ